MGKVKSELWEEFDETFSSVFDILRDATEMTIESQRDRADLARAKATLDFLNDRYDNSYPDGTAENCEYHTKHTERSLNRGT